MTDQMNKYDLKLINFYRFYIVSLFLSHQIAEKQANYYFGKIYHYPTVKVGDLKLKAKIVGN